MVSRALLRCWRRVGQVRRPRDAVAPAAGLLPKRDAAPRRAACFICISASVLALALVWPKKSARLLAVPWPVRVQRSKQHRQAQRRSGAWDCRAGGGARVTALPPRRPSRWCSRCCTLCARAKARTGAHRANCARSPEEEHRDPRAATSSLSACCMPPSKICTRAAISPSGTTTTVAPSGRCCGRSQPTRAVLPPGERRGSVRLSNGVSEGYRIGARRPPAVLRPHALGAPAM